FELSHEKYRPVEINARDKFGNTPLHYVVGFVSQRKVMEFLLKKGADPNLANDEGSTPLHSICKVYWNNDDLTKIFLEVNRELDQTVQIDALDKEGRTPLQLAVANFLPHTVNVLLDSGADLSGFVFPTDSYFAKSIIPKTQYPLSTSITMKVAAGALAIVESLEKRGYELGRSDIMTIVNFFDKLKIIKNLVDTDESWCDNEEFAEKAKNIMINSSGLQRFDDDDDDDDDEGDEKMEQKKKKEEATQSFLSLYDLMQLRPKEATKLVTHLDYFEFAKSEEFLRLPHTCWESCATHLFEKLSRRSFWSWALEPFWELIYYWLPLEMCEMILEKLKNKDLYHIFLAVSSPKYNGSEKNIIKYVTKCNNIYM
ncbi:hypothetical protein TKK_0005229, partial [Trichogramma kaykai]